MTICHVTKVKRHRNPTQRTEQDNIKVQLIKPNLNINLNLPSRDDQKNSLWWDSNPHVHSLGTQANRARAYYHSATELFGRAYEFSYLNLILFLF